jgi:ABC-2 type transport system permease protein
VARPSLDDVYLRHVGHHFATQGSAREVPVMRDTWWMTHRLLKAQLRQPAVLVITLVQPMVWLFLFGNLFRRIVELPGFGTAILPGLSGAGGGGDERGVGQHVGRHGHDRRDRAGHLNRFLITRCGGRPSSTPTSSCRRSVVAFQSTVIVLLGWAAGAHYPGRTPADRWRSSSPRSCSAPSSAHCPMCWE